MYKQVSLKLIRDHSNPQNSPLHLKKSHQTDNKIFISRQQRFPSIKSPKGQQPGPGSYIDPMERSRLMQKQKCVGVKGNHLDGFVSREHQWIFGSDRLKFAGSGSGLGPGAYQLTEQTQQKSSSPNSWGKSSRFNGTEWSNPQGSIGPGAYQLQRSNILPRRKQMGIFKSKSPKTFLQQLQKDIEKQTSKNPDNNNNPSSFQPFQPQDLQPLQTPSTPHDRPPVTTKLDPVFLSRSKRYQLINPQNTTTGPGSYQLSLNPSPPTKPTRVKSVIVSQSHLKRHHNPIKDVTLPGPASYQVGMLNMEREVEQRITSLKGNMSLETRWGKNEWQGHALTVPGPGHYNRQRYMFIDEKQYEHKPLVSHHQKLQIPFLSSSNRAVESPQRQNPFGQYNLNQFDMSEKMKKKRTHIERLKAMDISVPGFESAERRTVFNMGRLVKGVKVGVEGGRG